MPVFDKIYARDPASPDDIASNATIALFDPADPNKTPVSLTKVDGVPLANPYTVDRQGEGPAFIHDTLYTVGWEGGGKSGVFNSVESMRSDTLAAKEAAEQSRLLAEDAQGSATAAASTAAAEAQAELEARIAAGDFKGPKGDTGLPGPDAIPADDAVATYATTPGTATNTALNATIGYANEPTGADDTANLQARINATAANGQALQLKHDAVYLISDTLTVPSNAVIEGNGSTIQAKPGMNKPVMVNADSVNGNTNITLSNLGLDGNGPNQTEQFSVCVMTRVTHSKFIGMDVQGGLRNQLFPNGTFGEGFSLVLSDYNEVTGGRFHNNTYDGLKLRSSNWNRISNVLCDENGRSGIQISFYSPTGPPYNEGENVESAGSNDNVLTNIMGRHATGINHSAAPVTSGIYIHTGLRNIISNFTLEGFQQGVGLYATAHGNRFSDGHIKHRAGDKDRAGIDLENGKENGNVFARVTVEGMAGDNGRLVRVFSGDTGNQFHSCKFLKGVGTGTWTITNAGTNTWFLDCESDVTIPTGGAGAIVRDPKIAPNTPANTSRTEAFTGASGAIPYGWAARWATTGVTWTETTDGLLRAVKTTSARTALANVVAGDALDVEVLAKIRTSGKTANETPIAVVLRGSGAAGAENGYVISMGGASDVTLLRYANGVSGGLGGSSVAWVANTWYNLRARVTGSGASVVVQARLWADGTPEPETWGQLWVTDTAASRITTPGFHGVFGFTTGYTSDVDTYISKVL